MAAVPDYIGDTADRIVREKIRVEIHSDYSAAVGNLPDHRVTEITADGAQAACV